MCKVHPLHVRPGRIINTIKTKMALSKPFLGIQSPMQCQLCEQSAKITWKCLECELLMCSACKNNVHPKIKTAKEHRIIDIKEIGPCGPIEGKGEIHVVGVFQTKLEVVLRLAVSLDNSLWVGDRHYRKKGIKLFSSHTGLQKVKIDGKRLQIVSSFNIVALGISMTPNNNLLIVAEGSKILKQIKNQESKITDSVFDFQPYVPMAIHVTGKYKIIAGVFDQSDGTFLLLVMNHEGNQERVYGKDVTKGISFTQIFKIAVTSNDDIFVIDTTNRYELYGSVKVLGLDNVINTYSGHPDINTDSMPFTPTDMATTPADNIIITDIDSNVLHILNSSGKLITYINTLDKGIDGPHSICIAAAGEFYIMYIGTSTNSGEKEKGKLYKLNISGI